MNAATGAPETSLGLGLGMSAVLGFGMSAVLGTGMSPA